MPRTKKYAGLYGRQEAYKKTEKGKEALKRYESSEARRAQKRELARRKRGTIVDKQQWFIDNYGEIEVALAPLEDLQEREAIELYYGLTGEKPITQSAIAKLMGMSQPKISQIIRDGLKKLKPTEESSVA